MRDFEWTWTKAVVIAFFLWMLAIGLIGFLPSWWLYFADQKLRWRSFWQLKLRDLIAVIIIVGSFSVILFTGFIMQEWRNSLRGTGAEHRTGGYR